MVAIMSVVGSSCSDDDGPVIAAPPIDLVDPCSFVTSELVSQAFGTTMLRSAIGDEEPDRYRVCRWVEDPSLLDTPSIDFLEDPARNYLDIVLRQTIDGAEPTVAELFEEVTGTTGIRQVPELIADDDVPFLADDAVRTESTLWVLKGESMAIVLSNSSSVLDLLIESVLEQLIDRL